MTKTTDNFEELHAPEVVKPLSPIPEHLRREKPANSGRVDIPHKAPPSVENKHRKEEIARIPAEPESGAAANSTPPQPPLQPQKALSSNLGWVVIPIAVGILLLIWYETSNDPRKGSKETTRRTVLSSTLVTVAPSPAESATTSVLPLQPLGCFHLSAFAIATDGQQHSVTGIAAFVIKQTETNFAISTNIGIPCLLRNIPAGEHRLSLTVAGYRPSPTSGVTIITDSTGVVTVALQPLPAKVRFVFPTNDVKFLVYDGVRLIEKSNDYYDLEPVISHNLTFKARGWRDKQQTVTLAEPGIKYRCPVEMEKIEARLQVTVNCLRGKAPISGFISFDGDSPIKANFPITGTVRIVGPMTLALSVEGYHVLNNTQRVNFVDRQMTNIVFIIEPDGK